MKGMSIQCLHFCNQIFVIQMVDVNLVDSARYSLGDIRMIDS